MGSSSRKKSTSKKKSSKLSSKVRSMKKSKRTRSRKRGRRHDTSTDDDSVSSLSITSPSDSYSDGDSMSSHSRRRSIKKREKRSRKTSSRRKDSRDLSRSKKRKKPKKNDDSKPRKKLKRDVKISSAHSCSTCNESISDSERSEGKRVKKRSREHQKSKRDRGKGKSVSPLSTSWSPSPSYIGYQDAIQTISQSEETFSGEKNSRRLRSVIVIPEKPEKDMHFEEIVHDHDDFPYKSSSGEGGIKGPTLSPPDASAYGQQVEKDGFTSDNNGMSELTEKRIGSQELEVERVSETKVSTNKSPLPDSGPGSNDLEAILKQKALENLKKFRGARKTSVKYTADQKDVNSGDHNGSVSFKTETDKNKSPQLDFERDIPSGEFINKASGPAKQCSSEPPDATLPGNPIVEGGPSTRCPVVSAEINRIETESSLSNPEPSMITRQKSPSPSLGANQGTACSSALAESAAAENAENPSLNNQPNDAKKDSSQYQQKTMSVMRGGEMVQVNYKVYIPKRAPALAKRHLNRSDSDRTAGC